MATVIASIMADGQIVRMAVAALTQRLDVFQRCIVEFHVLTTNPAWNHAVELARYGFVDFVAGKGKTAHRDNEK